MSNFLRIADVKLPTAAYAKSLNLSSPQKKNLIKLFEDALRESHASKHQWKRFRIEKGRYIRALRQERNRRPQTNYSVYDFMTSAISYPLKGWLY